MRPIMLDTLNTPVASTSTGPPEIPTKPSNKLEIMTHVLLRDNQRAMADNYTCLQQLSSKVEQNLADMKTYEGVLQTHHDNMIAEVVNAVQMTVSDAVNAQRASYDALDQKYRRLELSYDSLSASYHTQSQSLQAFTAELHREHSQLLHLVTQTLDKLQDQQSQTLKTLSSLEPLVKNIPRHVNDTQKSIVQVLQRSSLSAQTMSLDKIQDRLGQILKSLSHIESRPQNIPFHIDLFKKAVDQSIRESSLSQTVMGSLPTDNSIPLATVGDDRYVPNVLAGNLPPVTSRKRKRLGKEYANSVATESIDDPDYESSTEPSSPEWRPSPPKLRNHATAADPRRSKKHSQSIKGPRHSVKAATTARQQTLRPRNGPASLLATKTLVPSGDISGAQMISSKSEGRTVHKKAKSQAVHPSSSPASPRSRSEGAGGRKSVHVTRPLVKGPIPPTHIKYLTRQVVQRLQTASPKTPSRHANHSERLPDLETTLGSTDGNMIRSHPSSMEARHARSSKLSCIDRRNNSPEADMTVNLILNRDSNDTSIIAMPMIGQAPRHEEQLMDRGVVTIQRRVRRAESFMFGESPDVSFDLDDLLSEG